MASAEPRTWRVTVGLLAAPLLWLLLFFVIPVGFIAAYSAGAIHILPTDPTAVSFDAWRRFLTGNSIYLGLFW